VTRLTNPFTGHSLDASDEDVEFWTAAGYKADKTGAAKKAPAKKTAAKKASSNKSK
jgi:hypothetical protein